MSKILSPKTEILYRVHVIETWFDVNGQLVTEDLYHGPFITPSGAKRLANAKQTRFDKRATSLRRLIEDDASGKRPMSGWNKSYVDQYIHATISITTEVSDPLVWN